MEVFAEFLKGLSTMRRAPARGRSAPPGDEMPYKPLLVLAALSLLRRGRLERNRIGIDDAKAEFDRLYRAGYRRPGQTARAVPASAFVQPYWFLKSSPFWRQVPAAGREAALEALAGSGAPLKSVAALKREIAHVALHPPELFELLRDPLLLEISIQHLLATYFDPPAGDELRRAMEEEAAAPGEGHPYWSQATAPRERDLVRAYGGRCAVCRLTARGDVRSLPVDAAHVRPRSWGGSTDAANLILLCKLHHWAFDAGAMTIDRGLTVHVSAMCSDGDAFQGQIASLEGVTLVLPASAGAGPSRDALEWHGSNLFSGPCLRGCVG